MRVPILNTNKCSLRANIHSRNLDLWWRASVLFSSSFRIRSTPQHARRAEKKDSWHCLLDTIISYPFANIWRDRVFASVVEFKSLAYRDRRARIARII